MNPQVNTAESSARVVVDERVFPRPVSLAAAYRFIDRCYLRLERMPRRQLLILLKGKQRLPRKELVALAQEFENELLHQLMRHQVSEKTAALREVIVGRALWSAEPVRPQAGAKNAPEENLDYLEDPLGIAIPWEEKYGEQKKDE